jgi:putative acetyltransferase
MKTNENTEIQIRPETPADYAEVENMTRESFWNLYFPGCDEHYLVHQMRNHPDFLPDFDFVAEVDGKLVGSILFTRSKVIDENGEKLETLTFGPLCVRPGYQRRGIGTALIAHTRQLAEQRGYPAIIIYGSPHNYCEHGFKNGRDFNVSDPKGKYPCGLLVLELTEGVFAGHQWKHHYSDVYQFDQQAVEEFDRGFPPKVKAYQYSQTEFGISIRAYLE